MSQFVECEILNKYSNEVVIVGPTIVEIWISQYLKKKIPLHRTQCYRKIKMNIFCYNMSQFVECEILNKYSNRVVIVGRTIVEIWIFQNLFKKFTTYIQLLNSTKQINFVFYWARYRYLLHGCTQAYRIGASTTENPLTSVGLTFR